MSVNIWNFVHPSIQNHLSICLFLRLSVNALCTKPGTGLHIALHAQTAAGGTVSAVCQERKN